MGLWISSHKRSVEGAHQHSCMEQCELAVMYLLMATEGNLDTGWEVIHVAEQSH